eukprot:1678805-Prorocentrum_lima.AAC.1
MLWGFSLLAFWDSSAIFWGSPAPSPDSSGRFSDSSPLRDSSTFRDSLMPLWKSSMPPWNSSTPR